MITTNRTSALPVFDPLSNFDQWNIYLMPHLGFQLRAAGFKQRTDAIGFAGTLRLLEARYMLARENNYGVLTWRWLFCCHITACSPTPPNDPCTAAAKHRQLEPTLVRHRR